MRNRNIKINVFLNEDENKILNEKVKKSGLNKSEFFRKIILDYQLKEKPDEKIVAISKEITPIVDEIRLCDNILKRAEEIKKRELHHKLEEEKTLFAVKKKKSKSRER